MSAWLSLLLLERILRHMIYDVDCNLLEYPKLQAIGHFCNCHCIWGGLAGQVKNKYPEAYNIDRMTSTKDIKKLGDISAVLAKDGKRIINCYTQYDIGSGRHTNYEAVYTSLKKANDYLLQYDVTTFGLPFNAGAGLGGGNWKIIRSIIEVAFDNSIDLYICKYEPSVVIDDTINYRNNITGKISEFKNWPDVDWNNPEDTKW